MQDDIAEGITAEERGFATFPVPGGPATRRIVGAATVLRNTTSQPMQLHVRFRFVDQAGHGWQSAQLNDWAAILNAGWAHLPAGQSVELGGILQVDADEAARVAGIKLYVNGQPTNQSVLLPATIAELKPRSAPTDEWDYVAFDVDNPGGTFAEPNYSLVYRSPEGKLIGGWFVDRANFLHFTSKLPKGETDRYPRGASRHTLPTWLPPDIGSSAVTMHIWPS
ncbi:hypothetical protein [Actinoplanes sp. L3-i22]|uniref:hypothetical protein n=1 Tax=Actinoplanes sp. L3-i22 TaxID=2836373 RepID=UPI001C86364C|nr:hypothetical protein [Actinoplanes sp. L3-i22]